MHYWGGRKSTYFTGLGNGKKKDLSEKSEIFKNLGSLAI